MKRQLALLFTLVLALACIFGQTKAQAQSTNAPIYDLVINTNPTNALEVAQVRLRLPPFAIDSVTFKPVVFINVELWGDEVDGGVTNRVWIRTINRRLTDAQLTNWRQAADGRAFIKAALLQIARTTESP
jgi:hypothetical protein